MNANLQRKALAALDGWRQNPVTGWWFNADDTNSGVPEQPDYLNSFDAIIPLICKHGQHSILHTAYWSTATPAHLCEELLKREGKWVED